MTRDDETRLTVPRGTGDRDMSITGRLHRHGRLRESRSSESDVERSLTVQDTTRKMGSTSEYMAKCKYKLVTYCKDVVCDVWFNNILTYFTVL